MGLVTGFSMPRPVVSSASRPTAGCLTVMTWDVPPYVECRVYGRGFRV